MWWQRRILLTDFALLKKSYGKRLAAVAFVLGFMALPVCFASVMAYDKANLNKALSYADQTNADAGQKVDAKALERTLSAQYPYTYTHRPYGLPVRTRFASGNIPLVSGVYKFTVLGGKRLNRSAEQLLRSLFFDDPYYAQDGIKPVEDGADVRVSRITHSTDYDAEIGAYRTRADLSLQNGDGFRSEFSTVFYLPDGAYVSDYYLYVGDEKKPGLLTDRRAAVSIYQSIVVCAPDPGILHYIDDNLLELRVFPFSRRELRRTDFELIHKNSLELMIDGHKVDIDTGADFTEFVLENAALLSSAEIHRLHKLDGRIEYSFIVDCSNTQSKLAPTEFEREDARQKYLDLAEIHKDFRYGEGFQPLS